MEEFLKKIQAKHRIRDPLYGFIFFTDAEKAIIDTQIFQRLRRVHQLALTKYVYPSAEHSRFVHSLGVMHCATMILSGIYNHKYKKISSDPNELQIKTLRFSALLHDIGHLPFSHALEKHFLSGLKHEALSEYIISDPRISSIIESDGVDPKAVGALLAKKPPAKFRLLHEVISGQLDADRADYLLRDAHLSGAKYGEYDFPRFLQLFSGREDDDEHGHLTLFVDENDLHVAESMLIARYHYNLQIPYHRTRMGFDLVLERFIRDFPEYRDPFTVEEGRLTHVDLERFTDLDDCEIMERIKKEFRRDNPWAPYLLRAKHLIPVIDTSSHSSKGDRAYKDLVRALKNDAAFCEGADFFHRSQEVEIIKGAGTEFAEKPDDNGQAPARQSGMILLHSREGKGREPEYVDIRERSWIFKHFVQAPHTLYRVYVVAEKADRARDILAQVTA